MPSHFEPAAVRQHIPSPALRLIQMVSNAPSAAECDYADIGFAARPNQRVEFEAAAAASGRNVYVVRRDHSGSRASVPAATTQARPLALSSRAGIHASRSESAVFVNRIQSVALAAG